jgi:hypothetical protein
LELVPEHDKGLCNVHARGLAANVVVSDHTLELLRQQWIGSKPATANAHFRLLPRRQRELGAHPGRKW